MTPFAASTHTGLLRDHNEDCFAADSDAGIWLVADGVGGHSFGEVASDIVRTTVARAYSDGEQLVDAIRRAHQAVLEEIGRSEENLGMGSTVVACTLVENAYQVAWVGDSRAYLWDGEALTQLTRDHTHVYDLVDRGIISSAEAATHPDRHVLTQSLGVFDDMDLSPGRVEGRIEDGQQILLCSDGLTDELSDHTIAVHLRRNGSTQSQVDGLVQAALSSGGRDNITVVVVGKPCADGVQDGSAHPPDLNTTQDIGLPSGTHEREDHGHKFWFVMFLMTLLITMAWLLL